MKTRADFPKIRYPGAPRGEEYDEFFGIEVPDPYRWMEEETAPEVQAWIEQQDAMTQELLAELPEHRAAQEWLESNWIDSPSSVPVRRGERTFWQSRPTGADHDVIYCSDEAGERVVFDLNARQLAGARLSDVGGPSPAGRFYLYGICYSGADASTLQLHDVDRGEDLAEVLSPSLMLFTTQSWLPDESGFFYSYLPWEVLQGKGAPRPVGLYLHRVGTSFDGDELIAEHILGEMKLIVGVASRELGVLLVQKLHAMSGRGGWGVLPLDGKGEIEWLFDPDVPNRFAYVGCSGSEAFWVTDFEAPNWRVVALDLDRRGLAELRTVVAEREQPISMEGGYNDAAVALHAGRLYVSTIHHSENHVRIFDLQGGDRGEMPLPPLSRVTAFQLTEGDDFGYVGIESFVHPSGVYRYDVRAGELSPERITRHEKHDDYRLERVFFTSAGGTRCPMTLITTRGYEPNGDAPVLLHGYGGWGYPWLPRYRPEIPLWLELGGVYAVANLRGGMEYGEAWHQAGQFFNKQNVFDDFCAAARYLVAEGHTRHERITIIGASNGGLLTAACYNQHPELFGAVVSQVAAIDLMRLWNTPIGGTQTTELGAPVQSKEMAEYLLSYSPMQNVRHEGPYPPILSVVGENDPRCKPGHIYKYVAELQSRDDPERLALLRVIRGLGHVGRDRPTLGLMTAAAVAWGLHMTGDPDRRPSR